MFILLISSLCFFLCLVIFCIYPSILICIDSNQSFVIWYRFFLLFSFILKMRDTEREKGMIKRIQLLAKLICLHLGFSFELLDLLVRRTRKAKRTKTNKINRSLAPFCVHPLLALCRIKNDFVWMKPLALFSLCVFFRLLLLFSCTSD